MDYTTQGGDQVRERAESTVATIADQATQTAEAHVSTQKQQAAQTLQSLASVVRDSGDKLRSEQPQLASLAEQAAQKVDQASEYLSQHDVRDLIRASERFARREPLIVLGGAFAIGFLAARFLKATTPPSTDGYGQSAQTEWYGSGTTRDWTDYRSSYGSDYRSGYIESPRERSIAGSNESTDEIDSILGTTQSGQTAG
jgi:ElaB/YqjD/DUF883 family membrane-anchored ribosome-binding protein